jgi:phosphinothricin acetyltransferase
VRENPGVTRTTPQIRSAIEADARAVNSIYNYYVERSHATFDTSSVSEDARRTWLAHHRGSRYRVLVACLGSDVIGFASSGSYRLRGGYDTTVETSVYVAPERVGDGIGRALYTALFDRLADEDVHRAVAGITQPNEASVALHQVFGFRLVGRFTEQGRKFGRYWDVDWYERVLP